MKSTRKLEMPRDETCKKMGPVTRDEFTALVKKAIQTPTKKAAAKSKRGQESSSASE